MAPGTVDLLVGIDFGMTCTGVAFAKRNMDSPRLIQEWPLPPTRYGRHNKVRSTVLYDKDKKVKEWGFTTNDQEGTIEWFKRYLEEKCLTEMVQKCKKQNLKPPFQTLDESRKIYRDYMTCLYQHIAAQLTKHEDWKDKSVEFVFSLPATFRSLEVSTALMEPIKKAGFGSGGKRHRVSWGLSEPQAAAVHTAKEVNVSLNKGDIILVCDAGGGTTDLALLEQHGDEDVSDLRELSVIQGRDIGSTNIDNDFLKMVKARLLKAAGAMEFDKKAPTIMMHSDEFQTWKHEFGKTKEEHFSIVRVTVPILKGGTSNKAAGITDGKMNFTHADFRSLFDPQVNGIIRFIQGMIDKVTKEAPSKMPNYIVLSGGLGSSAYVQQKVRAAFPNPKVVVADADEPQLSVVKGLILDRKQRDRSGRSALSVRKARASYGVVTAERYNKHNPDHAGLTPKLSSLDGHEWVNGVIKWVIKKGEDIDSSQDGGGKYHGFKKVWRDRKNATSTSTSDDYSDSGSVTDDDDDHDHHRHHHNNKRIAKRELVICHLDPPRTPKDNNKLPAHKSSSDVFTLCTVESDLSGVEKKHIKTKTSKSGGNKSTLWPFSGSTNKYYEIDYEVKFVVGAIDARFELWVGKKEYAGKNSFKVEWEPQGLKSLSK